MGSVFADSLDSSGPRGCRCPRKLLHKLLTPIHNAMSMLVISLAAVVSAGALVAQLENYGGRARDCTLQHAADLLANEQLSDLDRLELLKSWSTKTLWSTEEGIYYMFSLLSTIGYGTYFPVTAAARGLSAAFIVLIVPFGVLHMQCLASVYHSMLSRLLIRCRDRLGTHPRLLKLIFPNGDSSIIVVPASVLTLVLHLHLLLSVGFLCLMESWTPMESLYFLISAATTIGFGDFHTGSHSLPYVLASITFQLHLCACYTLILNYLNDALEWILQAYFAHPSDHEDASRESVSWRPSASLS